MIPEAREVRLGRCDRKELEARCRSPRTMQRYLKRARIVLLAADGLPSRAVRASLGAGAAGQAFPRGGLAPPILCQLSWRTPSWVTYGLGKPVRPRRLLGTTRSSRKESTGQHPPPVGCGLKSRHAGIKRGRQGSPGVDCSQSKRLDFRSWRSRTQTSTEWSRPERTLAEALTGSWEEL
jgi:hypothetical protein